MKKEDRKIHAIPDTQGKNLKRPQQTYVPETVSQIRPRRYRVIFLLTKRLSRDILSFAESSTLV